MALYREYTDTHPGETCSGCPFFVIRTNQCTYKSKRFYCRRDEIYYNEKSRERGLFD